jgi:PleD family two-component response regulator
VINGEKLEVTSSFGVCEANQGMTLSHAVKQADKALYHAKDTGRNKVCNASSLT